MTIKHIDDKKNERVISVKDVTFDAENDTLIGIGCPSEKDGVVRLTGGYAFVMNDLGKTVAAYNLRPKPRQ